MHGGENFLMHCADIKSARFAEFGHFVNEIRKRKFSDCSDQQA